MTCIADTASINLTLGAQLSADLVVDPGAGLPPNPLVVNPAGVYVVGSDGWIPLPATLAFSSADGHTFVATSSVDLRSFLGPGDRIRLVQSGVPGYYVVTAIAAGTITLYGGASYTLAATAITVPFFSKAKSPVGFSLDPAQWTEQLKDVSVRSQASPVSGTWYNPGSLSLAIPIGAWTVSYGALVYVDITAANVLQAAATLSTANNSASDSDFTASEWVDMPTGSIYLATHLTRTKTLLLAVKTSYFLNVKSMVASAVSVALEGGTDDPSIIRAICAYL